MVESQNNRGRMMRAFLSHYSGDKPFVEQVSKQLGRQYCVFDKYEFKTGEDFKASIRKALELSSIFVLFASEESLKRTWVQFEQNEAELMAINGGITRPLVFLLGDNVSHRDLPEWLQRGKVQPAISTQSVTREIQYHLQELTRNKQQPIYVGRRNEFEEAEQKLLALDDNGIRKFFVVFGLAGIGRRSFAKHISEDLLRLHKNVVIRVQEGDDIPEITSKMAAQAEIYTDLEELKNIINRINSSEENENIERLIKYLKAQINSGELPILFDEGGIIDNDGYITKSVLNILEYCSKEEDIYLGIIASRKPTVDLSGEDINSLPSIKISPLNSAEVVRLLNSLAATHKVTISINQVKELADYIGGYPPAAHYAIEQVREYGPEAIVANKYQLVDFRASYFVPFLNSFIAADSKIKIMLGALSYYSPLPLPVLGEVLGANAEELYDKISFLVDTAIIIPDIAGLYRLSDPLVESVQRIVHLNEIPHSYVASSLKKYVEEVGADGDGLLDLSRTLFRARRLSGSTEPDDSEISLVSDLISLETEFYHARDYESALKIGLSSLEYRPNSNAARSFVIRSLAQLGRFKDARYHINELINIGHIRDAYFLEGFVSRLEGDILSAIKAYEQSISRGRRGIAVHRELANCYFQTGNFIKARQHIDKALAIDPNNRYLVDLQIVIAVKQRDQKTAREKLMVLEKVDREEFYLHRCAIVEQVFGDPKKAYEIAKNTLTKTGRPTFAMLANTAKLAMVVGDLDSAAEYLNIIDKRFKNIKREIKIGLRCRWEISSGNFKNALGLLSDIKNVGEPVYLVLKRDAIYGLVNSGKVEDEKRDELVEDLRYLNRELEGRDYNNFEIYFER